MVITAALSSFSGDVLYGLWWTLGGVGVYMAYSLFVVFSDNQSDAIFKQVSDKMSKSDYLNMIFADSRTRFTVAASLISAIIVSLNAWLTRWENQQKNS